MTENALMQAKALDAKRAELKELRERLIKYNGMDLVLALPWEKPEEGEISMGPTLNSLFTMPVICKKDNAPVEELYDTLMELVEKQIKNFNDKIAEL